VRLQIAVTEEPFPGAAFMHLIVLSPRGHLIKGAQSWLRGAGARAELTLSLPADTYVVGVESYWELRDGIFLTGTGQYRLTVVD
jgi:hypothetical protein